MACLFFSQNPLYRTDYLIYDGLINLLTCNFLNKACCLDRETALLLEQPIKLLSYSSIEQEDEIEEYSKLELSTMVNRLLSERQQIMDLFGKIDMERRKLREDNMQMLERFFFREDPGNQRDYERFLNRAFLLNYELMRFFLDRERKSKEDCRLLLGKKTEEINELTSKIANLEKKLLKSRENLKQYLVTGKINPDEITSLGLTSHKADTPQQDSTAGVPNANPENNQIDFSQDWEKMSLNSHNSNLVVLNNIKKNLTNSASKAVLAVPSTIQVTQTPGNNHNKLKLQETKSKIDKYFNSKKPVLDPRKPLVGQDKTSESSVLIPSHLKLNNHLETGTEGKGVEQRSDATATLKNPANLSKTIPKVISHADNRPLGSNRPASQSKIHLKKNNVNEKNNLLKKSGVQ